MDWFKTQSEKIPLPLAHDSKKLTKILFAFASIAIGYFLLSLIYRVGHVDDYWLGEYAYWLAQLGYVKSELLRGYENYEIKLLVYHKLFIAAGALIIKSTKYNLYLLKSISIVFLIISISIMWKMVNSWIHISNKRILYLLLLIIIFTEPHIFEYGFVYRPEIMLMTWGLFAYYLLEKAISSDLNYYICLCGVFTGLSFLTHLNGIAFVLAGGLVLVSKQKWKLLSIYSLSTGIVAALYYWDVQSLADVQLFFQQFRNDPALDDHNFKFLTYFFHIFSEHERFFHGHLEIFISSLFFLSFYVNYKYLRERFPVLVSFYGFSILALAVVCYSKTSKYLVMYMPFMCIVIALGLYRIILQERETQRTAHHALLIIFALYISSSFIFNFEKISLKAPVHAHVLKLSSLSKNAGVVSLKPNTRILGSLRYTFEFTPMYQLQALHLFPILSRKYVKQNHHMPFLDFAAMHLNEYIFLDGEYSQKLNLQKEDILKSRYQLLHQEPHLWILKSKTNLNQNRY